MVVKSGEVFTEKREVNFMLDKLERKISSITILEPSFGEGAFLLEIFKRIIRELKLEKKNHIYILKCLKENVHGYEINEVFYNNCLVNIDELLKKEGFKNSGEFPNLKCCSFLMQENRNYDLVIGNPPYVRVHNLKNDLRNTKTNYSLINGTYDLYLMFIEKAIENLKCLGSQLIFLIPNSFGKSKAAYGLRKKLFNTGLLDYTDCESEQLFINYSVYSSILNWKFGQKGKHKFGYYGSKIAKGLAFSFYFEPVAKEKTKLSEELSKLKAKNGIATLADKIFISSSPFPKDFESSFVLSAFKGSRPNKKYWAIFPYIICEKTNSLVRFTDENHLKNAAPNIYFYLLSKKKELIQRSLEKNTNWYEYGRSQGLKDVPIEKLVINTLMKKESKSISYFSAPKKSVVFSCVYSAAKSAEILDHKQISKYVRFKAKDARGGYKKINSFLLSYNEKCWGRKLTHEIGNRGKT